MTLFPRNIQVQRSIISFIAAALFSIAAYTFLHYISLPTDENWFRNDIPSNLLVVRNFKGDIKSIKPYYGTNIPFDRSKVDSIKIGDLVLNINDGHPKTIKDVYEIINNGPQIARFVILRPSVNYTFEFAVKQSDIPSGTFAHLSSYAYVTDVIPNGASDRAGMKVGDLIIRINDQEFKSPAEADHILRSGQIGKSLKYDILRNNEFKTLQVVLSQYGVPFAILIFALSGFVFMIVGSFIVITRPNIFSARLIGFAFLLSGFAMAVLVSRNDVVATVFTRARNLLMTGSLLTGISLFFHSEHYFPLERPELIAKKWRTRAYYAVPLVFGTLTAVFNNPYYLIAIPVFGVYVIIRNRKGASTEYKRLNLVIKWTGITVVVVGIAGMLLFRTSSTNEGVGIMGIALALIPLSYLYTIGRYRLLDTNFRVRRNMQYSFITTAWTSILMILLIWGFFQIPQIHYPVSHIIFTGASIEISDLPPDLSKNQIPLASIYVMLLALGITFAFIGIRRAGQHFIDRKYYRQRFDYRQAGEELGELLGTTLTQDGLAEGLVHKLGELMKLKKAGVILFRDETSCTAVATYGFDVDEWRKICRDNEAQFIAAVSQFKNESRTDYLTSPIKEAFQKQSLQYIIPIRSKNKLLGTIVIGEKLSETTYQQEDLSFLSGAAKQASVSIENAFLYEELAEKERMKHELEIARRIQLESLPQTTPNVRGLEISGMSIPAMEVGGDFYDYLTNTKEKLTIIIGDVSGKGTSAALYMSKVQGILRSLHGFDLAPKELFHRANTLLCKDLEKRSFVTVLGAEFDTVKRSMSVARAGHLPLLHFISATGKVEKVVPKGLGLGLNDKGVFIDETEQREVKYDEGDVFLFATDGVTEAHNSASDFGEEQLCELLLHHHHRTTEELQQLILDEVKTFVGDHPQHDDQTIVIVKAT